ncbi:MAG: ABC transporter permease, partial [Thiomicrorhabdus sp.]|nr:ABC transporter permease [Thiomicrorhabdus sp.]
METKVLSKLTSIPKFSEINWATLSVQLVQKLGIPLIAIGIFLAIWGAVASQIQTSLGAVPGPTKVWEQTVVLYDEHVEERTKEEAFYERQEKRNAKKLEKNPDAKIKIREYTGKPTFYDQIITSIVTVLTGFIIASLIAIPVGVICGLNTTIYNALNPLIQTFKPVSPLAWLPIVTMIVSAVYISDDPMFSKSFLNSAFTVTRCCLWPTIINTAVGVSGVSKDLINVSKVLRLNWITKTSKIVIP